MAFINWRTNPQARDIITEMFNHTGTGNSNALAVDSMSQLIICNKTANNTVSFTIQGTWTASPLEGDWCTIGSAITTAVGTAQTLPFPYLRVKVGTNTTTAKTASSVTQTGGTATFTNVGHGFVAGDVVTISGANQAGYNGKVRILTTPSADTFTYAVDAATVTPATGTVIATGNLRIYCSE